MIRRLKVGRGPPYVEPTDRAAGRVGFSPPSESFKSAMFSVPVDHEVVERAIKSGSEPFGENLFHLAQSMTT